MMWDFITVIIAAIFSLSRDRAILSTVRMQHGSSEAAGLTAGRQLQNKEHKYHY